MTKSKQVVYQDNEYVIFEDGSGGAIMSNEEIEDAEKFDYSHNSRISITSSNTNGITFS
ncbi:hypothetical protein [Megamonas funiformis]|uniref:hypothetical protein n=1 Tax=Megamonas funiformis TaxID=437897 RepID=UPI002897DC32|nr:hypothetical protein [Megamonas funiformis]